MTLIIDTEQPDMAIVQQSIAKELELIFAGHKAVGLDGYMCLYTADTQDVWRSEQSGDMFWFNAGEINNATQHVMSLYNNGALPNSSCLLNPIIHEKTGENEYKEIGSGVFWATGFTLGVEKLVDEQKKRLDDLGLFSSYYIRGDNKKAGLKILGLAKTALQPTGDGYSVTGCSDSFSVSGVSGTDYAKYYPLSGLNYLCTHGMFVHNGIDSLIAEDELSLPIDELVKKHQVDVQKVIDACKCFESYDREHILYERFGQNTDDIAHNNKFYDLCARDLHLFDRTGPMRIGSDESFEFVVPGYIPRGAVTLLAAPGGTGKSSVAHLLCVLASMDTKEGDPTPMWLGQPVNMDFCKDGICVYFSGEDGPAITNARGALFDPEGRSTRLQFHRSEFYDQERTFAEYLTDLQKMPKVPIVVIDPARKYLNGDEDDSEVVSEFFEAIEEFAIRKQSAVIVVHHLQKGANPRNSREVLDQLRGSQVFIDRPRVVIGMCRDDKHTIVGLAKNNIPPSLGMVTEDRVFARNPKNLQLIWLKGEEGIIRHNSTEEEIQALEAKEYADLAAANKTDK